MSDEILDAEFKETNETIIPSDENKRKLAMLLEEKQQFDLLHNYKMELLSERILRLAGISEENAALEINTETGVFKCVVKD